MWVNILGFTFSICVSINNNEYDKMKNKNKVIENSIFKKKYFYIISRICSPPVACPATGTP